MAIQNLTALLIELIVNLLQVVKSVVGALMPHITADKVAKVIPNLVEVIYPAILWVLALLGGVFDITKNSNYDVVNGTSVAPGDPGTPSAAFGGMVNTLGNSTSTIIGPSNGTSGLTYVLNNTKDIMSNTSSDVGSELLVEVYSFISWAIGAAMEFMSSIPEMF